MSLLYVVNPKRRKKSPSKKRASSRRRRRHTVAAAPAAPKRRRRKGRAVASFKSRSYRKNPRFGGGRGIVGQVTGALVPAAIAGAGALGVDVLLGYLPVPDRFKTGALRHVTRAAAAIALGVGAGFVLKKETASQIMAGGLTVAAYGAMRDAAAKFAPNLPLAGIDDPDDLGDLETDLNALLSSESGGAIPSLNGMESDPTFASPTMQGVFNEGF
jgi:hypothetical protein